MRNSDQFDGLDGQLTAPTPEGVALLNSNYNNTMKFSRKESTFVRLDGFRRWHGLCCA
ncbi:hypothetical protein OAO87_02125 [bacterium]|nr:hypothetical protein [bacterium]